MQEFCLISMQQFSCQWLYQPKIQHLYVWCSSVQTNCSHAIVFHFTFNFPCTWLEWHRAQRVTLAFCLEMMQTALCLENMHVIQERKSKWKQYVATNSTQYYVNRWNVTKQLWLIFSYLRSTCLSSLMSVLFICSFSTENYLKLPF